MLTLKRIVVDNGALIRYNHPELLKFTYKRLDLRAIEMGNETYTSAEIEILILAADVITDSGTPGIDLPDD